MRAARCGPHPLRTTYRMPSLSRGEPHHVHASRAAVRCPALPVHGRPQAPGRPPRVPRRGPLRRGGHRPAPRQGDGGGRGARTPRGPRRRLQASRQAPRGQRPGRRRPCHRLRRAAPGSGRPAGAGRPRGHRPGRRHRPLHACRGRGGRRGRRARRGLLLHRPLLAHPDQARPATRPASASSGTPPRSRPSVRGSPSAGSTPAISTRCWTPERAASSSSGPSPRRRTPRPPPRNWPEGSGRAPTRDPGGRGRDRPERRVWDNSVRSVDKYRSIRAIPAGSVGWPPRPG